MLANVKGLAGFLCGYAMPSLQASISLAEAITCIVLTHATTNTNTAALAQLTQSGLGVPLQASSQLYTPFKPQAN